MRKVRVERRRSDAAGSRKGEGISEVIRETFSKRQERLAKARQQDVYQYDVLPQPFRVQVAHMLNGSIGNYYRDNYETGSAPIWKDIKKSLCKEHGLFSLNNERYTTPQQECTDYVLNAGTDKALDAIEFCFQAIDGTVRHRNLVDTEQEPGDAIEELNGRFKEHGIGYQFIDGFLIRIGSQFIHAEVVKPALSLLNAHGFDGPADEFITAFKHHRHGRDKEAIVEALKAFESTMKAICVARKWKVDPTATAKELIKTLLSNGLIPPELESHFTGLRTAMESGLPTVRNRTSGHGQGAVPVTIPPHITAYALHLAAANIILLAEAHRAMK
jgi:hypothetical protein